MQDDSQPSLNARLIAIGVSESYASLLANNKRAPSLALALRIESELGIPVSHWGKRASDKAGEDVQ